jgi:hypothetical protein
VLLAGVLGVFCLAPPGCGPWAGLIVADIAGAVPASTEGSVCVMVPQPPAGVASASNAPAHEASNQPQPPQPPGRDPIIKFLPDHLDHRKRRR